MTMVNIKDRQPITIMLFENVVDTLKGRTTATTNALEGLKVVDIIERIYEVRDMSFSKEKIILPL